MEPSSTPEPEPTPEPSSAPEPTVEPDPNADSNPSGLPMPGDGGIPAPSGAADNLSVLDWAGFTAAVTYTFDDSNSSQISNYAALQALGVPFTFYLQTNKINDSSSSAWAQALSDGHELANHTQSHQGSGPNIGADTDAATAFIKDNFGVDVWTMAAPNGSTDYIEIARTRFLINRGVADKQIAPNDNSDPFNLNCYIPQTGAPASAFNAKIDAVRDGGDWQVVLVHGFNGGNDGAYQPVELSEFVASVEHAKSFGDLWLDTMVHVGAYWRAQKMWNELAPTDAGGSKTWNWTLPDHFPPGMYLRVVVDGGTLTQDGSALPWNDHGYYEVALDAGALTLSP